MLYEVFDPGLKEHQDYLACADFPSPITQAITDHVARFCRIKNEVFCRKTKLHTVHPQFTVWYFYTVVNSTLYK